MKRTTFSVVFFCKKTKLTKKGKAPIYARITTSGQISEIHTQCQAVPEHRNQHLERGLHAVTAKKKEEPAKAEEPAQPRRGIEAGKLKGMDVDATAEAVEQIGTLFHDPNPRNTKSRSQTRRG